MKYRFTKSACAALALCIGMLLSACGNGEGSSSSAETTAAAATEAASSAETTAATSSAPMTNEADLHKLHQPVEGGDAFSGYWKISDGTGSQFEHFVYSFDGTKNAYLLMGTMGYCGVYEVHIKDNKDVFSTKLMFGLNGDYTYEFSKDKKSAVLTNIETGESTSIEKLDSYSSIPDAAENPVVDKALLGAWLDDTGEYLYFGSDGISYITQKNINFTFYQYEAKDGTIHATYTMNEPTEETATYKIDGDKLIYNNYEYHRISAAELV